MSSTTEPADAPPPELLFRRRVRLLPALADLWRWRELLAALAEREFRSRYKQAFFGFAWAFITPLMLMVLFSVFLQRVTRVDSGGAPYPLFTYLGLIPWTFFSTSVSQGGQSLYNNSLLLNKVVGPREVFPLSSVVVAAIESLVSLGILGVLFGVFTYAPRGTAAWALPAVAVQVAFTIAVTIAVSAVLVYLRDLHHALPLILQLGLFATPIAWGLSFVPSGWQHAYAVANPLGPVIDTYRRTILLGTHPQWDLLALSAASAALMLVGSYALFKHLETGFMDVA